MGKIIWAPSALKDIESIARFIERDSIDQASLFVTRIIEMTDRLDDFPRSGRVIPEINDDHCREIVYGAYRVMRVPGTHDVTLIIELCAMRLALTAHRPKPIQTTIDYRLLTIDYRPFTMNLTSAGQRGLFD